MKHGAPILTDYWKTQFSSQSRNQLGYTKIGACLQSSKEHLPLPGIIKLCYQTIDGKL